jgi:hypothetical protein
VNKEAKTLPLQRMQADFCFCDPDDVNLGTAVLVEHGFDVEILDDSIDECGPTIFVRGWITTTIAENDFLDWAQSIVDPLGGDTIEAGLADPPSPRSP